MAEKIERLELQSESKDKVWKHTLNPYPINASYNIFVTIMLALQRVVDLQELYNSQQILTAELSEKLEKTEVYAWAWFLF